MGTAYSTGRGVPQDVGQAVHWWRKAANHGHALAQLLLGGAYAFGQGVPKDDVQAVLWFREAAAHGHADAQYALSRAYANGRGVPRDDVEAHKWMHLAALHAHQTAHRQEFADERDTLAEKMSPAEIAEAHKRADEWTRAESSLSTYRPPSS